MTDIDAILNRVRESPIHPALAGIDDAVLDRLGRIDPVAGAVSPRAFLVATAAALSIGIAGSFVPGTQASAVSRAAPLGTPSALAPSTLLDA